MNIKRVAQNTAKVLISYLTYQAVQTIVAQLRETNPPLGIWLNRFSSQDKIQDGEAYIQELLKVNQELAMRVMTVRAHLAEEVTEFLPEMACTGIQQANMEHRRQHLEHIAQLTISQPAEAAESAQESTRSELDSDPVSNDSNESNAG